MSMEYKRINSCKHELFEEVFKLYEEAFGKLERRDFCEQVKILSNKDYYFYCITDGGEVVGGILFWMTDKFAYLEHLFIDASKRNNRYGTRALDFLKSFNLPVIAEIEPPETALQERRKNFYERCGFFTNNDIYHIQPKLHLNDKDLQLLIISYPNYVSKELYSDFYAYLKREVEVK